MITDNVICTRCGKGLQFDDVFDCGVEEEGKVYYFTCPHCGAKYECYEPSDEEKGNYEFYKNEKENVLMRRNEPDIMNGYCTNCGHSISMSNNFMLSDYDDTITDENDDKMNFILNRCPFCGMEEVRWDTAENEKKDYPYWQQEQEEEVKE